jgi:hypothetical protein
MEPTKVYVLIEWVPYEGSYLYGVFSSWEKADEAASELKEPQVTRSDLAIHEIALDAVPNLVSP